MRVDYKAVFLMTVLKQTKKTNLSYLIDHTLCASSFYFKGNRICLYVGCSQAEELIILKMPNQTELLYIMANFGLQGFLIIYRVSKRKTAQRNCRLLWRAGQWKTALL